jgi:hypothetical protein
MRFYRRYTHVLELSNVKFMNVKIASINDEVSFINFKQPLNYISVVTFSNHLNPSSLFW